MKQHEVGSAAEVEARLRQGGLVAKSEKALGNIIAACNFLATHELEITPTSVGSITSGKVGGPKIQSIRNNKDFRSYIAARRAEQGQNASRSTLGKKLYRTGDNAIDAYIQSLESELLQAKNELRSLRSALPRLGPYDLTSALAQGVLTISVPSESTAIPICARQACAAMLNPNRLSAVGLELVETGQIISRDNMDAVLLSKREVDGLRMLV